MDSSLESEASFKCRFVEAHEQLHWPDVYFRPDYGRLYCGLDATWRCLLWHEIVLLPLLVRPVPAALIATVPLADGATQGMTIRDAVSPYGYSGAVVLHGDALEVDWNSFWRDASEFLARHCVVCAFLRCCPYIYFNKEAAKLAGLALVERTTYSVDMTTIKSVAAFLKQSRKGFKGSYVKGRKAQLLVQFVDMSDTRLFEELYAATMVEVEASKFYQFSHDYFVGLYEALGKDVMQLHVCTPEGVVVAATIMMRHASILHYHLSCSNGVGKMLGATHFMWGFLIEYALREGIKLIHLGGGVHEGDSLEKFKKSFGNVRNEYIMGQWVIDPNLFEMFNTARARQDGLDVLPPSTWFPPYRKT
jgi:hypothetical protein